jgi:hypothetical protein
MAGKFCKRKPRRFAAVLLLGMLAGGRHGAAAGGASPAEISAQRQEILDAMLNSEPPYAVAAQRWVCAMGKEPAEVAEHRAAGAAFFPDAADSCVTALIRTARDRRFAGTGITETHSRTLSI